MGNVLFVIWTFCTRQKVHITFLVVRRIHIACRDMADINLTPQEYAASVSDPPDLLLFDAICEICGYLPLRVDWLGELELIQPMVVATLRQQLVV